MNQQKIGIFIAQCRKEKKLTQVELAEKLGVTDRSVSKWETGKCMPDLSLFKPLCNEFEITINELLSGEKLTKEIYQDKFEENILNTINYSNQKIDQKNNILGVLLLVFGFLIILTATAIFPMGAFYSVLGIIISLIGFSKIIKKLDVLYRVLLNTIFFIVMLIILISLDYINVKINKVPPRFFHTITVDVDSESMLYDTPFYDIYICNVNKDNERFKIEKNSSSNTNSIMDYCNKKNDV